MPRFVTKTQLVTLAAWLASPAVVLADDCSDMSLGELVSCGGIFSALPMLTAAALLVAAANGIDEWGARRDRDWRQQHPYEGERNPPQVTQQAAEADFSGRRHEPGHPHEP